MAKRKNKNRKSGNNQFLAGLLVGAAAVYILQNMSKPGRGIVLPPTTETPIKLAPATESLAISGKPAFRRLRTSALMAPQT